MLEPNPSSHVSSFDLDLLELGGLDPDKKRAVDEHLRSCAACQRERESMRKLRADFSEKVMPRTLDRVRERALSNERPLFARPSFYAPLLASAAALVLWVAGGKPGLEGAADDTVRAKGRADVQIVARRQGHVMPLDAEHHDVAAGDEVRFVVTASDGSRPHLFIASVDGTGRANVYFPYEGTASGRVNHLGRWEVPGSIVLDESPGPERVFALFSKQPLARATVTQALGELGKKGWDAIRSTDRLDMPDVEQTSFVLEKTSPGAP